VSTTTPANDIKRRRAILQRHVGNVVTLKRDSQTRIRQQIRGLPATLLDVRRSYAELRFEGINQGWLIPIEYILLPGSVEPDPRQRKLFS